MPCISSFHEPDREYARRLDAEDELARFRDEFVIADPGLIYLDGNSLGRLPRRTLKHLGTAIDTAWGSELIRSWNSEWFDAPTRIGEKVASLIGAGPGQVVISDSTSVNLFKLSMAALALRPGRPKIVSSDTNFPSDIYVLQGCARLMGDGYHLDLVTSRDGIVPDLENLHKAIDAETALVTLSHVEFKSGYLHEAAAVTAQAHKAGALVLWDLSHSVGAVPVELDAWNVDLAIGCTYKYLNGGPGSPSFMYVRRDLQSRLRSPIWGWFGQRDPFDFELEYDPVDGITRFLVGTPPILSLLALEPALDTVLDAGTVRIRLKSQRLTSYLIYLVDLRLVPLGFQLGSPLDPSRRGSHVSIRHPEGYRICRALVEEMKVIPDFREPDNIRLGLAPLYSTYTEVWEAVDRVWRTVADGTYLGYPAERLEVT